MVKKRFSDNSDDLRNAIDSYSQILQMQKSVGANPALIKKILKTTGRKRIVSSYKKMKPTLNASKEYRPFVLVP